MSSKLAARLQGKLDRELSWRKKELISTYMDVPDDVNSDATNRKCRQAVLLLYSHWEGFAKRAFRFYLDELARAKIDPRELCPELLGLCMHSRLRIATQRRVAHDVGKQLKIVSKGTARLPGIPTAKAIKTRSNLSGSVLREILETIGLDPTRYAAHEANTIQILLRIRNEIAHGGGLPIPLDSYRRLHHSVIDLMDDIRVYLEDSLSNEAYLEREARHDALP